MNLRLTVEAARIILSYSSDKKTGLGIVLPRTKELPFITISHELCAWIAAVCEESSSHTPVLGPESVEECETEVALFEPLSLAAAEVLFAVVRLGVAEIELVVPPGKMPHIKLPISVSAMMVSTYTGVPINLSDKLKTWTGDGPTDLYTAMNWNSLLR